MQTRDEVKGLHNCREFSFFYCFHEPLKITTREKIKNSFQLIKTYLLTTLIWQWHFSTEQSKLTFENLVIGDVACIFTSQNHVLRTLMQARLSANQSARTILVILSKTILVKVCEPRKFHLHMPCAFLSDVIWQERLDLKLLWESVALKVRFFKWRFKQQFVHQYFAEDMGGSVLLQTRSVIGERDSRWYNTNT